MSYMLLAGTFVAVVAIWLIMARYRFATAAVEKARFDQAAKRKVFQERAAEEQGGSPNGGRRHKKRGFGVRG